MSAKKKNKKKNNNNKKEISENVSVKKNEKEWKLLYCGC